MNVITHRLKRLAPQLAALVIILVRLVGSENTAATWYEVSQPQCRPSG